MLSALRKVLSFDFANRHCLDRAMSVLGSIVWRPALLLSTVCLV